MPPKRDAKMAVLSFFLTLKFLYIWIMIPRSRLQCVKNLLFV